ncbi:zinc finger BED domain-containing protein 6-like [Cotesia glomerata]|uniref:zinc finger BED domain-containing protein 6-like n=1 Tax=Cotesia glomerata TaxID=32391 RepID=UPI001D02A114|nr:zinc finger BED domain-containing protein 6-like [Cotesia glomerata]
MCRKSGLKKFVRTVSPLYKLPCRKTVTSLIENRYNTTKSILIKRIDEADFVSFTSDILTITNSTRSFLVLTVHFIDSTKGNNSTSLQSINLCAQKLSQSHTAEYIKEIWNGICEEFEIDKSKIVSISTDGGANMVAAVRLFLGNDYRIPCMAHSLNLIVDGVLREVHAFSALCDHVKSIVTFFKQSVNASDQLRAEQIASGKKEGEALTLIQAVSTRWNSCLDMLVRFVELSALVAKILATKSQTNKNTPDMVATSQLNIIRDLIKLLGPFKEATEEISGAHYVTSSLVIPVSNLLRQAVDQSTPSTSLGETVRMALLEKIDQKLASLETNTYLSAATILDPRFKRIHFTSPRAVSNSISKISNDIRSEHRRRGQRSPDPRPVQGEVETSASSIWCRHEKLINLSSNRVEIPSSGCVPNELKQYLDQPILERKSDPIEFWVNCRHFTPVLAEIALKYLICQGSSVSSERLASAVNLTVPNNRSRLTGEHIKERVLLMSISDEYWFE